MGRKKRRVTKDVFGEFALDPEDDRRWLAIIMGEMPDPRLEERCDLRMKGSARRVRIYALRKGDYLHEPYLDLCLYVHRKLVQTLPILPFTKETIEALERCYVLVNNWCALHREDSIEAVAVAVRDMIKAHMLEATNLNAFQVGERFKQRRKAAFEAQALFHQVDEDYRDGRAAVEKFRLSRQR